MKPDLSSDKPFLKPSAQWTIAALTIAAIALGGAGFFYAARLRQGAIVPAEPAAVPAPGVAALGRLSPEGDVIDLAAPTAPTGSGASRVVKLLVEEGDRVQAGQIVAILDSHASLQAAVDVAREEINVAQAQLARVNAGSPTGDRTAQAADVARLQADLTGQLAAEDRTIARLQAELSNRQIEHQRFLDLFQAGAVTASQLDEKQLALTTAENNLSAARANRDRIAATLQRQIEAAQATLSRIAEVRPTDVQMAQAEVDRATANLTKAQAELELGYVRAPREGQILTVHTRPGERIGDRGVVALGQTEQMNVIAEVYELDVSKVKIGQTARITSSAFVGELKGTVTQIGLQVNPQAVLSTNPTSDIDRRIVEVKIRLDRAASERVSALTSLQVNVVIDP